MKRYLLLGILSMFAFQCTQKEDEVAIISTRFGDMVVTFYPEVAPQHVESFKLLAKEGYFDGTTFHRVLPEFVIQGGDPNSRDDDRTNDGMGGRAGKYYGLGDKNDSTTWTIPAEFNDSLHVRGTVSMARSQDPNSASSQFFICVTALPRLDHQYTVFGKVIKGLDIIDSIVAVPTPRKEDPFYQGIDGDNPLEKIEMTVRILPRSQVLQSDS